MRGERNEYLRQRDVALGERNEFLRQRDEALGERNELRRQLDERIGQNIEHLRQRDVAIGECNELRRQLNAALTKQAQTIRLVPRAPDHRSLQRSIFIASLPKSGTEFIGGAIRDTTKLISPLAQWDEELVRAYFSGYCNREDVFSTGVFVSERLLLEMSSQLSHGYVYQSHCAATHHNLCVLRDAGFERATVLVRDPRDSTVSWTHHLPTMGPNMVNYNSLIQHLPPDYFLWPHQSQLAFQVRTFLPAAVNWIESWVGAAVQAEQPVRVQFAFFDDLRSDPSALLESILKFHRVGYYDLSMMQPPTPGKRHFRQGKSGSWREEFSPADRRFADELIGKRLERAFDRITH